MTPSASSRRRSRQRCLGARAAGRRVGDDADLVAARRLAAREVEDMPEQAADRRAQHMQDFERRSAMVGFTPSLTMAAPAMDIGGRR